MTDYRDVPLPVLEEMLEDTDIVLVAALADRHSLAGHLARRVNIGSLFTRRRRLKEEIRLAHESRSKVK